MRVGLQCICAMISPYRCQGKDPQRPQASSRYGRHCGLRQQLLMFRTGPSHVRMRRVHTESNPELTQSTPLALVLALHNTYSSVLALHNTYSPVLALHNTYPASPGQQNTRHRTLGFRWSPTVHQVCVPPNPCPPPSLCSATRKRRGPS
jgi:hypothetical protein